MLKKFFSKKMLARLGILGPVVLYLAATLFFAQLLLVGYLSYAWRLNSEKLSQIVAIAQGIDLFRTEEKVRKTFEEKAGSIFQEEVIKRRAERDRDVEFEKLVIDDNIDQILSEARWLKKEKEEINWLYRNFEKRLDDIQAKAEEEGFIELTQMLETIDPALAKRYLLDMIEKGEENRVVQLIMAMDQRRRAKIIDEMQQDPEVEEMAEIFDRIAKGDPTAELTKDVRDTLQNQNGDIADDAAANPNGAGAAPAENPLAGP
jgi:HAMP domain-containing protein